MSDSTQEQDGSWSEDAIIERYHQLSLARDGGVAVGVDEAIDAAMEIYKDMQAAIDALRAQPATHASTYRPIEGNITFARNGNLFVMDATTLDGLPFPDGVRLCSLVQN